MNKEGGDNLYLPEDADLLKKLNSIHGGPEWQTREVGEVQVRATLRTRKTMVDLDASNKRFSYVLGFFALVQLLVASLQFLLQVADSANKPFSIFLSVIFLGLLFWLNREMSKFISSK